MNGQEQPATKADVAEVRTNLTELEARLIEHQHHIETSLLRGAEEIAGTIE